MGPKDPRAQPKGWAIHFYPQWELRVLQLGLEVVRYIFSLNEGIRAFKHGLEAGH